MTYAHFPGSLPFDDAEQAFSWIGNTLGERARLVPDGETGDQRKGWLPHTPWFEANPTLQRLPDLDMWGEIVPQYAVKEGVEPSFDASFEFAAWARDSYAVFSRLRDAGVLPSHAKSMVTLPHSTHAVAGVTDAASFDRVYEAFVKQMRTSVGEIANAVPHDDLAIQWDIPLATRGEFDFLAPAKYADQAWVRKEMGVSGDWVPEDVEVGYHVCFGDGNAPDHVAGSGEDTSMLDADFGPVTEATNEVLRAADRRVDFVHMPTHAHWLEPHQYEPLQALEHGDAELSIGVLNFRRDFGIEQGTLRTRQRTESGRAVLGKTFGISSTCGLGRYTPEQMKAATELYDELQD